jgi:hypothetical protein
MDNKSYSKGISWFDDVRIPTMENDKFDIRRYDTNNVFRMDNPKSTYNVNQPNTKGRFPANLLVCDDMLNDGIKPNKGHRAKSKVSGYGEFGGGKSEYHGIGEYMNVDSTSRYYDIDKWFNNLIDV